MISPKHCSLQNFEVFGYEASLNFRVHSFDETTVFLEYKKLRFGLLFLLTEPPNVIIELIKLTINSMMMLERY
jgi:hypothetical protein